MISGLHAQTQCLPCPPLCTSERVGQRGFIAGFGNWYSYKPQAKNFFSGMDCLEKMSITSTALIRPDRLIQCSLSVVLYTYLRIYICVTNCDLSADIHCDFWAACTDTVPALSSALHERTGWAESLCYMF